MLVCVLVSVVGVVGALLAPAPAPAGAKRLVKRHDLDPQTCVDNFNVHRDKIIRTEDSREMGAKYLNEVDLGSRDECLRLCCETDTCDVFVFEEKNPGSCYLFFCGPPEDFKCKFTRHTNFSSAILTVSRHLAELEDQIKLTKHEQDLVSLRNKFQDVHTTVKPTTQFPIQIHETAPPPVPVRRCSRYQFECHSSDECIAIYNACDGIPQCADGSDEAPELGCPATTKMPPSNYPPREILPHIPSLQQSSQYNMQDNSQKDTDIPHKQQAFMSPLPAQDGPQWPHHLDQLPQSNPHMKQFNDNIGSSHIFNHKGGLQVTETDSLAAAPFEYKSLPYDSMPDNNWQHRSWPQMQSDQINAQDNSQMYHLEIEPKNAWKQQSMQQPLQVQNPKYRMENNPNRLSQDISSDKMNLPVMPNMFQDREKMWAVPQQNIQDNQEGYNQRKMIPLNEEMYIKSKFIENEEKNYNQNPTEKNVNESNKHKEDNFQETVNPTEKISNNKTKTKENKNDKKPINKTKKKHLASDGDSNNDKTAENTKQSKTNPVSSEVVMKKLFDEDVHDGAAETPPGAILLLTLGVCMTSIMVVLIGCRLKMARRRMRKLGKSPFAHDADYLVNGMYL